MPGLFGSIAVGLGWNVYVWYRRRRYGEDRHTTSSAIRQLRANPLGDYCYRALDKHWTNL